jgi:hypothetical protein
VLFFCVDGLAGFPEAIGSPSCCTQTRVSRLEPNFLSVKSGAGDTGATLLTKVQTFGLSYPVGFRWGRGQELTNLTATTTTSGDPAFVVQTLTGLVPASLYSFAPFATAGTPAPFALGSPDVFVTPPPSAAGRPGPAGTSGPAGATGQPGRGAHLFALILRFRSPVHRGHRLNVRYFMSEPARIKMVIRHTGRRIFTVRANG